MKKVDSEKVFKCWNNQRRTALWKTHPKLLPDIIAAVEHNPAGKGWAADDMCAAIINFAKIVQGKEYKWTYSKWGLPEFLTRGCKEKDIRWLWFHPNNFREQDWLTKEAIQRRTNKRKQLQDKEDFRCEHLPWLRRMSDEQRAELYQKRPHFRGLIDEIRKEK